MVPRKEPDHTEGPRRPVKPTRSKGLAKKLALLAATLLLLAVGAEVATRLLTDVVPPLVLKDPVIGRHYPPSFEREVYVSESDRKVLLRFNRAGELAPYFDPDYPDERMGGLGHSNEKGNELAARTGHRFLTQGDPHPLAERLAVRRVR